MEQSRGQDIIAHQHRHLVVVSGIDRRLSSSLAALVHHIVVYKRSRVKQFQAHSRVLRHLAYLAKVLRHKQDEHWSHALARTLSYVFERATKQSVFMRERLVKECHKIVEFSLNRMFNN